ncbi:MAG: hypothetical protein ABIG29_00705 [Candidatus Nealsonbacteria bacterium]
MVQVNKKSWHWRIYNWFNKGKLPPVIDLCSYCRTVFFWAPLKFIFTPAVWLHKKSKSLSYLVLILLVLAINVVLIRTIHDGWLLAYLFMTVIFYLFAYLPVLRKTVASDWTGAEDTSFRRYIEKAGSVSEVGFKYSVGLPVKTVFWTIWVKIYYFNKVLFWGVMCLVVAVIFYGLFLIGWWWKVLIGIAAVALVILLIYLVVSFFAGKKVSLKDSLVWQFLVAQKRKICPFIELID